MLLENIVNKHRLQSFVELLINWFKYEQYCYFNVSTFEFDILILLPTDSFVVIVIVIDHVCTCVCVHHCVSADVRITHAEY